MVCKQFNVRSNTKWLLFHKYLVKTLQTEIPQYHQKSEIHKLVMHLNTRLTEDG